MPRSSLEDNVGLEQFPAGVRTANTFFGEGNGFSPGDQNCAMLQVLRTKEWVWTCNSKA